MSQKQYLLPYVGGKFIQVKQKGERSALEHIQKKIEYFLPIETVDVEEMRKVINYIRVNVNRDCTAEEVNGLVQSIKNLLNDALDNMPKHERYLSERGNANDASRSEGLPSGDTEQATISSAPEGAESKSSS